VSAAIADTDLGWNIIIEGGPAPKIQGNVKAKKTRKLKLKRADMKLQGPTRKNNGFQGQGDQIRRKAKKSKLERKADASKGGHLFQGDLCASGLFKRILPRGV